MFSLNKDKIKILLLEDIAASAIKSFKKAGYNNIETYSTALQQADLQEKLQDAMVLGIRSRTQVTADIINSAPKLLAIGCFCIGTNQVDLITAQNHGIVVFNAPFSNTRSVAELVIGEMIMLLRGIMEKSQGAHQGQWLKSAKNSYEIRGKKLGIIGYGHIGTQVGILAEALGMEVFYYDIENKLSLGKAKALDTLEDLLKISDIITLHVPQTPATYQMINHKTLALTKENAILINASRGSVVDINALVEFLDKGHIKAAALDVFPQEPKSNKDIFSSPLQNYPQVILTPHIGGSTQEAQQDIGTEVAQKLIQYSDNGSTLMAVNFPEVSLPPNPEQHRILNIHKNIPGIMSQINQVISEQDINITAQYLQTKENIGYVVIDVDQSLSHDIYNKIKALTGSIKTRMIYL